MPRRVPEEVETQDGLTHEGARVLARVLAEESARFSEYLARSPRSDHDLALSGHPDEAAREVLERPSSQIDWPGLDIVAQWDPEAAAQLWEQLVASARDELVSGHLAADALDVRHSPEDRARYLAVRDAFNEELKPRGAVEQALVDIAVHAYLEVLASLRGYHVRNVLRSEEVLTPSGSSRRAPTMDEAAARGEAMDCVERSHRLLLRTLRAIDEHRRRSPVIVQNAAQVNVADRQVNVAGG